MEHDASGDAIATDAGSEVGASVPCPTGPATTPVLIAHLGLDTSTSAQVAQTSTELFTAVRIPHASNPRYRIVAISKCGDVREVAPERDGEFVRLAIDGDTLFVADGLAVWSLATSGGQTQTIPVVISPPIASLAVDDADLWVSGLAQIERIPRDGGAVSLVNHGGSVALDASSVFLFQANLGLLRIAKDDPTQVTTLAALSDPPSGYWWATLAVPSRVVLSSTHVFFSADQGSTQPDGLPKEPCVEPKLGGELVCKAFPLVHRFIGWSSFAYFQSNEGIARMDSNGTTTTVANAPVGNSAWVDGESVYWLTPKGDLYHYCRQFQFWREKRLSEQRDGA